VRASLGVELPVHVLFDAPTVAGLGREVEAALRGGAAGSLPPIEPVPRRDAMPLSFAQQRLWFFERLKPGTAVFNIPTAFELEGALDVGALERSINEVVRRHEVLRTVLPDRRGRPVQVIGRFRPSILPVVDVSSLPEAARQAEQRRLLAGEQNRPFDLARGPLARWLLLSHGGDGYTVSFTVHHVVSDAWSSGVLTREVMALYRAFSEGLPSPLPELPVQYADFAAWQQEWLSGDGLAGQLAYWKQRLEGAPPLLELPADRPRPESFSYRGVTLPVAFPPPLAESLTELARSRGVTLFMTILAAFKVLLRHLSGLDDVVVGTDVANRNRQEIEGLIGFFINQLALRTDLRGDPSFAELLARVRDTTLGAYAHQDLPFERLVDALKLPRELSYAPVFQVKLFLDNTPQVALEVPGLRSSSIEVELDIAKLDLVLALWHTPTGLRGWINYSTDLYDRPRIVRLMRRFEGLLEAVAGRPEAPLSELDEILDTLDEKEREMEKQELRKLSFKKFKTAPKAVTLPREEVVEKTYLAPGQTLPLVIRALMPDVDLADWAVAHKDDLEADLLKHGAILFRGFGIDTPDRLEAFAGTICGDLFNENAEHPRESVSGNVYTPVFFPPDQELLWHNENSFNYHWPRKIFFACARPAAEGGETPVVDSRRVYEELPAEIRDRFVEKGVMYQRNYAQSLGLSWQTVFRAENRAEAEEACREARVGYDWGDGDRLRTLAVRPAVARHPGTGELTWFNQAQHWHDSCLDPKVRQSMRKLYSEKELPRQCYYGDGTSIPDAHMETILAVYRRLAVSFPWQRGDVMMVDNVLAAHGRNPFKGERKILVALGQMTDYEAVAVAPEARREPAGR
jgi:alpha-ketoglutarate-dependent taurine dioxygenase